ncbi:MAG: hypothetical protein ACRDTM_16765 [Micromonosporaceae bacterium]
MINARAAGSAPDEFPPQLKWRLTMDDFITLVRALLLDEFKDFDQRVARLQALRDTDGFNELLGSCFFLAVHRRFRPDTPVAELIRFVANTRIVYDLTGTDIDPGTAERLVRTALGAADPLADLHPQTIGKIEIVLLHKIVDDAALYVDQIDDFLEEANALAIQWRTEAAVRALEKLGYTVSFPKPATPAPKPARRALPSRAPRPVPTEQLAS